jgi:hypothetical protein
MRTVSRYFPQDAEGAIRFKLTSVDRVLTSQAVRSPRQRA